MLTIELGQEAHADLQRTNLRRWFPHKECEQCKNWLIALERNKPPMKPINNVPKAVINRLHQKKHQERQLQHSRQLLADQLFLQFSDSKEQVGSFFLKQKIGDREFGHHNQTTQLK